MTLAFTRLSMTAMASATELDTMGVTKPLPPPVTILSALGPHTTKFPFFNGRKPSLFFNRTTAERETSNATKSE